MIPPQNPDREAAIFAGALELPAAERAGYLEQACDGDPGLRASVITLLQAHESANDFMAAPAAEFKPIILPRENPGDRIGRYKLLQQIGEGGFGTVWMAEQMEPVSRRVALKIIKLGMDTKEVIARFEAERQALAMMDDQNIAKIFDAGATDLGRPFFVMELVKGIPITKYCDEAGLGTRQRLELFGDVCSAINHAHQKGIIHRDIKPSNVLITLHGEKPVVKIIDFGIAKATQGKLTDKTLFTRFEQFIGTPVYMSPEQASLSGLDIDTRSDIYALGVLLYELLVGQPPFDGQSLLSAGYEEMRRIIREVEPPKPSSRLSTITAEKRTELARIRQIDPAKVSRLVEPDLDWIVMKAIEKDRARRYETAAAFAHDIGLFLADEPANATPPSVGYQFRKFARRHRNALRVAAGIAAVLVLATAVSTYLAVRATRAERKAEAEAVRATAAEKQATEEAARATLAEKKIADTLVQVAAERDAKELARQDADDIAHFLSEAFRSPNPARNGRTITVAEILDTAAKKLETDLATQPARRAKLQATLASTYHGLGLDREAVPLQEKSRDFFLAHFGPENPATLGATQSLATYYHHAGRQAEALQLREELLVLCRKVLGPEHAEALGVTDNLANSYKAAGRPEEALKLREQALESCRKALGPEHPQTLTMMHNLASDYLETGRTDEALKLNEQVVALRRKVLGPEHPQTLTTMGNLATTYAQAGRPNEAITLREQLLNQDRKVFGPSHPKTLGAMRTLAALYRQNGDMAKAEALRKELTAARAKTPVPPATRD